MKCLALLVPLGAEQQFWWNWWVSFAIAFGTITAVLVALFGDWFKARIFPPKLRLSYPTQGGETSDQGPPHT
jgi:hypothetical protein